MNPAAEAVASVAPVAGDTPLGIGGRLEGHSAPRPQTPRIKGRTNLKLNQWGRRGVGMVGSGRRRTAGSSDAGPPSRYPIGVRQVLERGGGLRPQARRRHARPGPLVRCGETTLLQRLSVLLSLRLRLGRGSAGRNPAHSGCQRTPEDAAPHRALCPPHHPRAP